MASVTCWGFAEHREELEAIINTKHGQLICAWLMGTPLFRYAIARGPGANHRVLGLLWRDEKVRREVHRAAHPKHAKCFTV